MEEVKLARLKAWHKMLGNVVVDVDYYRKVYTHTHTT